MNNISVSKRKIFNKCTALLFLIIASKNHPLKSIVCFLKQVKKGYQITNSKSAIFGHLPVTFQNLYLHHLAGAVKKMKCD